MGLACKSEFRQCCCNVCCCCRLQSAVNLLSSVLDTPEFFWRAPDSYQTLYEAICQVSGGRLWKAGRGVVCVDRENASN
jgi:hypothetical protein